MHDQHMASVRIYIANLTMNNSVGKVNAYLRGADYLIALYALAKCDSLVAGMCGGSEIVLKLNKNAYRHVYLLPLGQYGIDDVCYE